MKKKVEEPNVWVTGLKVVLGAAAFIGLIWFALWYAAENMDAKDLSKPADTQGRSWGIVTDSPIRSRP